MMNMNSPLGLIIGAGYRFENSALRLRGKAFDFAKLPCLCCFLQFINGSDAQGLMQLRSLLHIQPTHV